MNSLSAEDRLALSIEELGVAEASFEAETKSAEERAQLREEIDELIAKATALADAKLSGDSTATSPFANAERLPRKMALLKAARDRAAPALSQSEIARRALELKRAHPPEPHPGAGDSASEGIRAIPDTERAPSGAIGAEGERPILERSHKVR
jgi:hypothetical protein